MSVTTETATVYRGGGRRWLTRKAAIKAEAMAIIKRKHPTESGDNDPATGYFEPTMTWRGLPRSDVLLRRMMRIVLAAGRDSGGAGT